MMQEQQLEEEKKHWEETVKTIEQYWIYRVRVQKATVSSWFILEEDE